VVEGTVPLPELVRDLEARIVKLDERRHGGVDPPRRARTSPWLTCGPHSLLDE
jgi:hypothetical protein